MISYTPLSIIITLWIEECTIKLRIFKNSLSVIHAVILAIINALKDGKSLAGATVFTTLFPGNVDAQLMVECGIKEVVYRDNLYPNQPYIQAATKIFQEGGVSVRSMQTGGVRRNLTFDT